MKSHSAKPSNSFSVERYFDVDNFAHKALFEDAELVWLALSQIESYLAIYPLGSIDSLLPKGVYLVNPEKITIGQKSKIEPGAYIEGPCIIGDECTIRHGAYIRGNVITGNNCVIGHDTEVKNSIFLNRAHAAHFAYLGDSILGSEVNLGAGVKCANLRFDKSPIVIHENGLSFETQMRKFGAILGDGCQLGCNSVTNPGTLMGKNSCAYPCTNFGGIIPSWAMIKNNTQVVVSERKDRPDGRNI